MQIKALKYVDPDVEAEQNFIAKKKEQLKKSIDLLKTLIAGAEKGDPNLKRQ